ncbi:MAG TPA: peptide chain release factor N(5)-glutamine methyltransferase [Jatrophihabitans sp.]|nr:peptide chain release factor N(5)-glutamine methyltransferase [Jatrophihabitans sp.]
MSGGSPATGQPVPAQLRAGAEALAAAGRASPRVDAELLLAHLLGIQRGRLLLADPLSATQQADYAELIRQRCAGVPLQHLTGSAPFRHLLLAVGPGVFVPRPETELLLDLAADRLAGAGTVLDLGAGSGAIALAVAQEYPAARVIAVERSTAALAWLRRNAEARAAAGDRPIEVVAGDLADPRLLAGSAGEVDVLLANPPYVPERIRDQLSVEVGHDPVEAVFGGPDGTSLLPALVATAARLLRPGGWLAFEHDDSHAGQLPGLLAGWRDVRGHQDLAGRPRFTSAVRADRPGAARSRA